MWPDRRILELFQIDVPIVQAPMAGAMDAALAIAACEGGALGSLPCAMLTGEKVRAEVALVRGRTPAPLNLNFFCHSKKDADPLRDARWRERLAPYQTELGLDPRAEPRAGGRASFDAATAELVEELKPKVVSFHFGLPERSLIDRVKGAGCVVIASATTVAEARWLEEHGVDAVIAQGAEAGGHRGMFLTDRIDVQPGTFALVPQVVDAVRVPVIAAGGIADGRGLAAAFALGAAGVQIGTAYLRCPEAKISAPYRAALAEALDVSTVITNVMSGRPARGIVNRLIRELGPISSDAPAFPQAVTALAPLRAAAEKKGSGDFSPLWAGQAAGLAREMPAADLTRALARDGLLRMGQLARST
jgi:nitronate monooxygenase